MKMLGQEATYAGQKGQPSPTGHSGDYVPHTINRPPW